MEFKLVLQDNNEKAHRFFFWFLFYLHLVAAGIFALTSTNKNVVISSSISLGLYVLILLLYFLFRKRYPVFSNYFFIAYAIHIGLWMIQPVYIAVVIVFLVILFAEIIRRKKTVVLVRADKIILQQILSSKNYTWQQIDNVILKDGLLTIDLTNNHLIQVLLSEENTVISETDFNRHCQLWQTAAV